MHGPRTKVVRRLGQGDGGILFMGTAFLFEMKAFWSSTVVLVHGVTRSLMLLSYILKLYTLCYIYSTIKISRFH